MTVGWAVASTGIRFDPARLNARLARLAEVPKKLNEKVAEEIDKDAAETFAAGQDPYGVPWAPRVREPKDGHPLLDDTGKMKGSRRVRPRGDGDIDFRYDDPKSVYHQHGTRNMAARTLVPKRGLPNRWRDAIKELFAKSIREIWPG